MRAVVALAIGLGLLSAVSGIALAVVGFEPIPFADLVDFYRRFFEAGGWSGYGFAELYERHNEHRLLVPRLWFLTDLGLFDGTQWFLIVVIVLSSLVNAATLSWLFRSLGHRGAFLWIFTALAFGAVLSPAQWENLVWGFQVQFVQVWMFATLAFIAASGTPAPSGWRVAAVIGCGLASTYSMANGVLVWPLLVGLALWCGWRGWPIWVVSLAALALIAGEAAGYKPHPGHGDPLETLGQPLTVAWFALRYLTTGVGQIGTLGQEILGAILVVTVLGLAIDAIRNPGRYRPAHIVLLAVAAFVIGAAVLTALGRVNFGVGQANAARYATPSFLFLLAVFALLLDRLVRVEHRRMRLAGLSVASILMLVPGLIEGARQLPEVVDSRDARVNAVIAYLAGDRRKSVLRAVYPYSPRATQRVFGRLDNEGLGPFAVRSRFLPPVGMLKGIDPLPEDVCRGRVEPPAVDPSGQIVVSGWALAPTSPEQPQWVLLTTRSGTIAGWGAGALGRRPIDVPIGVFGRARGFEMVVLRRISEPVLVLGVFADNRRCRIGGELPPLAGGLAPINLALTHRN